MYNINAENQSRQKGRKDMIETESTGLLTLYSDVRAAAVHWLWYPFIASGKITLLQGDPGDGKSTMMMRLIAELSTGGVDAHWDGRSGLSISALRMAWRIQSSPDWNSAEQTAGTSLLLMKKYMAALRWMTREFGRR